jgi:hypothetical protein
VTVKWSDIRAEFEGLEIGFRERVVRLFEKYEGKPTDEVVRGKTVEVTIASFAKHMGIKAQTFRDWVLEFRVTDTVSRPTPACINDGVPPRKSLVIEAKELIERVGTYLPHLSDETHEFIRRDIAALRLALDELEAQLKVVR